MAPEFPHERTDFRQDLSRRRVDCAGGGGARNEGVRLDWLAAARTVLLVAAAAWSVWLADRQIRVRVTDGRRVISLAAFGGAVAGLLAPSAPFVFRSF